MRIDVVGGGPGGLYLAILAKRDHPGDRVRVFERQPPARTYGFGVAFHHRTLAALAAADEPSRKAIDDLLHPWDDVVFHVRGEEHRIGGHGFAGCSRRELLVALAQRAEALGVELHRASVGSSHDLVGGADLVVLADGAASRTRAELAEPLEVSVDVRPNRYVWLGSDAAEDGMHFRFRERPEGVLVAHSYPYGPGRSTWIVETTSGCFDRLGIDPDDEAATVALVAETFAEDLAGHALVTHRSVWRRFAVVTCERWSTGNVVLLGDAKATAHFSIGSGTKLAMEDAVALHRALEGGGDVPTVTARYERERRPAVTALQDVARGSMLWFEQLAEHWSLPAPVLALSGITRKRDETYAAARDRSPQLAAAVSGALGLGDGPPSSRPLQLGDAHLSSRVVVLGPASGAPGVRAPVRALRPAGGPVPEVTRIDLAPAVVVDARVTGPEVVAAVRAWWPPGRAVVADVGAEGWEGDGLDRAAAVVAAGADAVSVTGGAASRFVQWRYADIVRQRLGVPTLVSCEPGTGEADTVVASGRADLVLLRSEGCVRDGP
jgi:anthraniloyl-CoA monooxygenase